MHAKMENQDTEGTKHGIGSTLEHKTGNGLYSASGEADIVLWRLYTAM